MHPSGWEVLWRLVKCGLRGAAAGWVWQLAWELRNRNAVSEASAQCALVKVQLRARCWLRLQLRHFFSS